MRDPKWYQRRLARYFEVRYGQYDDTVEFFPDPSDKQWLFEIPELGVKVKLTCYDNGRVTEFVYRRGVVRQ